MRCPASTPVLASRPMRKSGAFHQRAAHERRRSARWKGTCRFILLFLVVAALAGFPGLFPGNPAAFAEPPKATQGASPAAAYLELPLPQDGEIKSFTDRECLAPFEIKAAAGSNYLVKLADDASHAAVMTIFVKGGSTIQVDVPLGTYELKYAAGDKWYGYDHLFGPNTGYSKADTRLNFIRTENQVSGYSVTLYAVPSGNLRTYAINASEF